MAAQSSLATNSTISLSQKVSNIISGSLQDYNSWRSLISEIETASPEDINSISLAYDSFLSRFPLCHWHLEKYAYQKAKFCNSEEAANIYEQAVEVAMFSVGFWAEYFTFAATCFGSPVDIRRLFERAISFVGRDYCCHVLWDKYMKYEFTQEGWSFLAQSYIWALRFPTKKLRFYYDNFKQFVMNLEEEIGNDKNDNIVEQLSSPCPAIELSKDEISLVIKEMLESSSRPLKSKALDRYKSIGEEFYREARQMDEKIKRFETKIQRRYFDVTPLDDDQLINWHLYLDFIEKQDNLDSTMKLYERCLIPCANYPEFWMRYVEFLESKGGRELAISALGRATQIFLKSVPEIHLFDARFKEHIGDADGARAALALCDPKTDSSFIESTAALANLERRLGNYAAASATYEKALKKAREKQKLHLLPTLYLHFARLIFVITGNAAASRDVLVEGIRQVPRCRFLLEELVKFAMTHEGASHMNIITSIISDAISPGLDENEVLDAKDREKISCLFLEFVNLCGTMHDIREAWNRHVKLFPQSLRIKMSAKHHASDSSYLIGLARNKKGKYDHPLLSLPPTSQSDELHGQEQVPEFPTSNKVHPNQDAPLEEKMQVLSTKEVFLSNGDEPQDSEPACGIPCQSREDGEEPIVVSDEFSEHAKENALTMRDSNQDLSHESRGDEPGPMDVSAELGLQSKEDALSPPKSAHEVVKSTETSESIEAHHSSLPDIQPEMDHDFNQLKHSIPSDHNSLKSQKKESQELVSMSSEEYGTKRIVPAASESTPRSPKSFHSVESLKVCSESQQDESVSHQHNTPTEVHYPEEPPSIREDSIEIDNMVSGPTHAESRFQDQAQDRDHPANALNSKLVMNQGSSQQYPARAICCQSESGVVREDKATEQDQPVVNAQHYPARAIRSQLESGSVREDKATEQAQPVVNAQHYPARTIHSQLESGAVREDKATEQDQPFMNAQHYPARQQRSQSEDKATDLDQQAGILTPPTSTNMSDGQLPVSSQLSMNPIAPTTSQQQWQAQQSLAMNQMMLQYHYQQQQLLQQQYQQQMQMQHPHYQMQHYYTNQQQYQVQPQQQNQQYVEQQPQYVQQQQSLQQQSQQQHHQHRHEPHPNSQQLHDTQYQQSQDLAYQEHQLAYQQQATQEQQQQLLWQQYHQQYQGYQLLQQQQQLKEGSTDVHGHHMHQHPSQRQQDEQLQQYHQQAHTQQFTRHMSQTRQGYKSATMGYEAARPSESSQSPLASQ